MTFFLLPILSGILVGTSYIPFPPWALLIALVPLFYFLVKAQSPRDGFWAGWCTQFFLNIIGFNWVAYTAIEFGGFPKIAGFAVLLLFCSIAHIYYGLASWSFVWLKNKFNLPQWAQMTLLTPLFSLWDFVTPKIFPWNLGYTYLWAKLPIYHFADVVGFWGLHIFTLLLNVIFLGVILWWPQRRTRAASLGFATLIVFALLNLTGKYHAEKWNTFDRELKFLVTQGNIGNFEKVEAEKGRGFQTAIVNKYLDLTAEGLKKFADTQVVLWPETGFPDSLDIRYLSSTYAAPVRKFFQEKHLPLLTGAYSFGKKNDREVVYNGFFLLNENGDTPLLPYYKHILLAFGEYFPLGDTFPILYQIFPMVGEFGRGPGPVVMPWPQAVIGPQVCYEGLYPEHSAKLAELGAQIFTNVSNDSWYGTWAEPYQHLYMTLARAIEFRRPLIRATNTGISSAILANGEVLQMSPMLKEWSGQFVLKFQSHPEHTIYEKFGYLWPYLLAFLIVLLLVLSRGKSKES